MGSVLFIACTNVGRYLIEEIMSNGRIQTRIAGVVNLNSVQAQSKANYDSYADLGLKHNIPLHYCDNINDAVTLDWIRGRNPDIIIQSGWSQKFGDELLAIPRFGCIGEHPAPLPRGRGAACVNWAILTGERSWGDSFFQMVSKYDRGKIYAQRFFEIEEYDTVFTVYEKVAAASQAVVRENIDKWSCGEFEPMEQDDSKATYYKKRRPSDGEITSFDQPAKTLHDFIRAQTFPYPGAYFLHAGTKIIALASRVLPSPESAAAPGTVLGVTETGGFLVQCADGTALEILRVMPENCPSMWGKEWVLQNGLLNKTIRNFTAAILL